MDDQNSFRYSVAVQDDQPIEIADLAPLLAKAMHPNDKTAFAFAERTIGLQIKRVVQTGDLIVTDAKINANDARLLFESRGVHLQFTPHGSGPDYWTIRNAAADICSQQGLGDLPTKAYKRGMIRAVEDGDLRARDPRTLAIVDGNNVLDCWELVSPIDVNNWIRRQEGVTTWNPAFASVPARSTDSTIKSTRDRRRDVLTPVIEAAQGKCKNRWDWSEVWAVLTTMAEKKVSPLIGCTEDGIQYLRDGEAAIIAFRSLRKRIQRAASRDR